MQYRYASGAAFYEIGFPKFCFLKPFLGNRRSWSVASRCCKSVARSRSRGRQQLSGFLANLPKFQIFWREVKMYRYWTRLPVRAVTSAAVIVVGCVNMSGSAFPEYSALPVSNHQGAFGPLEVQIEDCFRDSGGRWYISTSLNKPHSEPPYPLPLDAFLDFYSSGSNFHSVTDVRGALMGCYNLLLIFLLVALLPMGIVLPILGLIFVVRSLRAT